MLAAVLLLSGCGSDPQAANDGDCNARIQFQGKVFRGHNLVNQLAPTDKLKSGIGDVLDCDGSTVAHVAVYKVSGVNPDLAVAVIGDNWPGVYVREGTGPSDWPTQLKASSP